MLYIFDLGNVVIDIDFNRVLGVWSKLSSAPLATLKERFVMGETFEQHERGEITDEAFAERLCHEMGISLSFEQFSAGWQAIFVSLRPEVIDIMRRLRQEGHRVVILSNTNRLHCAHWPVLFPEVEQAADRLYLSQDIGLRKPEVAIYRHVLTQEGATADQAVFFDDNPANIAAAQALGIHSILVTDRQAVPDYFASLAVTSE
ncbi:MULTISPECIES: glucose-1-phosphatase [Brenneria]|uniref:Glucose-1-phosphatase n=1 Tax=Brenneria nigrifluens DSM 30175 = ATCC 13028 TaxID=1121120 RepID=A0A2U1UQL8_9GAMM|nr:MULTISPECIES: glucose-1-phosphatase [Brenneria]EHD23722.1 HAD-superfamily hydrolase, subfamily IA, variant 3 [Brenneria sp. EniD312]PWC23968.1 glucose-1-phosphatase [Brenneria nigrifluens] [Brenneria nigrifluens DSM 30175 = ATCC 13028]QCR06640.1 glucose-1-phosphatase [Brenneria nigrifluens] [Brenneria nigrifluens DSM 30175 = ATCC 13028]